MNYCARLAAVFLAFLMSGCSALLPKHEPLDVYRLPASPMATSLTKPALDWQLRVDTPQTPGMFDSTRIIVLPAGDRISIYQGARWAERPAKLLRDRLIEAFRDNGRLAAVSSDDDDLRADFGLAGNLNAFQSEYRAADAKPTVVIRFDVHLVHPRNKRILATHRFEASIQANSTSVADVVSAFGKATDQLSAEIVPWTLKQTAALDADMQSGKETH